jgi:16S rRNA (guanine(966)-N(2))-methyltransferase RsmD
MRIISGKFKGRKISYTNLQNVRPTTDRTKESLFNILNQYFIFEQINALDLFSGSGNISYELASRGVTKITSVEKNIKCIKFIHNISKTLNIKLNIVNSSVLKFLSTTKLKFDLIIADPPYSHSKKEIQALIDLIFRKNILNKNGILIIEHHKKNIISDHELLFDTRTYGTNSLSFFK